MITHPLAEIFGFPANNLSNIAEHYRNNHLCPYNNKVPSCTKSKAKDPLGVCCVYSNGEIAITCPVRFRQDWIVISDAAKFLFPSGTKWIALPEIRLHDGDGKSAGNIDYVLVAYDDKGQIIDFGAVEVQSVYISGNIRRPFEHYMEDRVNRAQMEWKGMFVRADYLSSSRKRLIPQIIYKGKIINAWKKKTAIILHENFYKTLPILPTVEPENAEVAWLIYGLDLDPSTNQHRLVHRETVYTDYQSSLDKITIPPIGKIDEFINLLQNKLDEKLSEDMPLDDAVSLKDILSS